MSIEKNPRTDVDVALLREVFCDLLPDGREVTHEQVEAVLREARTSARYRRVVLKWRRQLLFERAVYLDGQMAHGRGFICLTPDEMVRFGTRQVRAAGRKLRKGLRVAGTPDDSKLSAEVRRGRQMLAVVVAKLELASQGALKDISRALAPPPSLPQRPRPSDEHLSAG